MAQGPKKRIRTAKLTLAILPSAAGMLEELSQREGISRTQILERLIKQEFERQSGAANNQ